MGYLVYAVLMLASAAASYYAAQKAAGRASQATAGTIDAPTAESGRPIPKLYGTKNITSPNVVWYGDIKTEAIQK